jgi:hypothetical protein
MTDQDRAAGAKRMADLLASGGRVVVASDDAIPDAQTVLTDGERHLVVKRRATREEFLATAPGDSAHIRGKFYYELELFHFVIERPDGERLGIRIRSAPRSIAPRASPATRTAGSSPCSAPRAKTSSPRTAANA